MTDPQQHFYQAIGDIKGVLILDNPLSILKVGDSEIPATISRHARKSHTPEVEQVFRAYPCIRNKKPTLEIIKVVDCEPSHFKLWGCWETHKGVAYFIIYRNELNNPGDCILRSLVPVVWENAPTADGQYWQAEAQMHNGEFVITKTVGPFDPPPKATQYIPPAGTVEPTPTTAPTAAKSQVQPTAVATSAKPLTPQEIRTMATPAKISLTCKLNQVPAHRELPDKQIEFFLNDGSDRIFTVRVKPKMFKKLTDHGFSQWVAAIGGDLGPSTETGFELLNASIQIFEKKAPADAPANETKISAEKPPASGAATARPSSVAEVPAAAKAGTVTARTQPNTEAKADAQVPVSKRKGLLNGVRMK